MLDTILLCLLILTSGLAGYALGTFRTRKLAEKAGVYRIDGISVSGVWHPRHEWKIKKGWIKEEELEELSFALLMSLNEGIEKKGGVNVPPTTPPPPPPKGQGGSGQAKN